MVRTDKAKTQTTDLIEEGQEKRKSIFVADRLDLTISI